MKNPTDLIIAILAKKPGANFNWDTVGGYAAGEPAMDALIASGRVIEGFAVSKTGRRMPADFLSEDVHLSGQTRESLRNIAWLRSRS